MKKEIKKLRKESESAKEKELARKRQAEEDKASMRIYQSQIDKFANDTSAAARVLVENATREKDTIQFWVFLSFALDWRAKGVSLCRSQLAPHGSWIGKK